MNRQLDWRNLNARLELNKSEFLKQLLDTFDQRLIDSIGHFRNILATYVGGSFGRNMTTATSDLDIILIVAPTAYDLLTNTNCNKQVHLSSPTIDDLKVLFDDETLALPIFKPLMEGYVVPKDCDIKFVDVRQFYKMIMNGVPNAIDYATNTCINLQIADNMLLGIQLHSITDLQKINVPHWISAELGQSNGILTHIDKEMKTTDVIKYEIKNFCKCLNLKEPNFKHSENNYYHLKAKEDLTPNELKVVQQDAIDELNTSIKFLKDIRTNQIDNNDDLHNQAQEISDNVTNLFLRYIKPVDSAILD